LRDVFLEVAIAVALATGGIVYVASHPKDSLDWGRISLAGNTAIVFGFLISWFRKEWRRLVFWTTLAFLLLCHTAAYVFVLVRIQGWPLSYYVVLNPIELALFVPILRKLVPNNADQM
jgi:hypothetical protein